MYVHENGAHVGARGAFVNFAAVLRRSTANHRHETPRVDFHYGGEQCLSADEEEGRAIT